MSTVPKIAATAKMPQIVHSSSGCAEAVTGASASYMNATTAPTAVTASNCMIVVHRFRTARKRPRMRRGVSLPIHRRHSG
jgi:hypothetical protein